MINLEKTVIYGWETAIRGMRNPMNSWDASDSDFKKNIIGPKDHELMMKLSNKGPVHSKFMRMITVSVDIEAPLYWWKEFDTYKVGTVANSCSTMHKIHTRDLTIDDFSHDQLNDIAIKILEKYIEVINVARRNFIETKDKHWWWQIIQLLPSSYNQKRTVHMNYAVLQNIYDNRKNHKLDEWRQFCYWIKFLNYSEIITREVNNEESGN